MSGIRSKISSVLGRKNSQFSSYLDELWFESISKINIVSEQKLSSTSSPTTQDREVDIYSPFQGNEFEWPVGSGIMYKVVVSNNLAWLDRNLGASQVATSLDDELSYGDLYQWGRLTDGHEKRNSNTTTTQSTTDQPEHGDFILRPSLDGIRDWRNPKNDQLWQGTNGTNNPAPPGWRLPTKAEWNTEIQSWGGGDSLEIFKSPLKLPRAGYREFDDGSLVNVGSIGHYWSSTVLSVSSTSFTFSNESDTSSNRGRAYGLSVRCVRSLV